jgi:hypothetical protein
MSTWFLCRHAPSLPLEHGGNLAPKCDYMYYYGYLGLPISST